MALIAVIASSCALDCKTCVITGPSNYCKPCPKPPKPLKRPKEKATCEIPKWPKRPVKCVTTQIVRKCCHLECAKTCEGLPFKIEVCEITYKSLYTDGSSKVWTEVSRNPVIKSASDVGRSPRANRTWRSKSPTKWSLVGDRCDNTNTCQEKIQHLDRHIEAGLEEAADNLHRAGVVAREKAAIATVR